MFSIKRGFIAGSLAGSSSHGCHRDAGAAGLCKARGCPQGTGAFLCGKRSLAKSQHTFQTLHGLGKFCSIRSSLQQQKKDSKKEDLICPATRWGSHFAKLPCECKQAEPTALVRQPTGLLVEAKTSLPFQARFWVGVWYGDFLQFAILYKWPSII